MAFILTVAIVGLLLVASEFIWRKHELPSELARKFVHVTVGTFVAFWPFFLSWNQIRSLSVAFIVAIIVSRYFKIFTAIHSVQRPTLGEIWFAVAVGATSLITQNKYIYAAAILQMSLADGLAAIIGSTYGRRNHYIILGQPKSLYGSLAFLSTSMVVLAWFVMASGVYANTFLVVGVGLSATILENLSVMGLDNMVIPIFVAAMLRFVVL